MREFTQEGMFNELSKVTRAVNKKKFEKMDLPRFGNGGDNPASSTPIDEDKAYLMRMANSPLFIERYARMVGKPVDQVGEEAEAYRQQILNNIETVKINDIGVFPKGVGRRDAWEKDGVYYEPLEKKDIEEAQQFVNEQPEYLRKTYQDKLNKEIADHPNHQLFLYVDDPWLKTHELSHASVKGDIDSKNVNTYSFGDVFDTPRSKRYYKNREDYLTEPNEQKARIDVARKYLESKGLYDPVNEPFTEKHYDMLKKELNEKGIDADKKMPDDIEEISLPYDKETVIKMFNDFVYNDPKKDLQQGRLGGLAKFIDGGEPEYTFDGRPDSRYKKVNGQWHIKNSSTDNLFVPINDPSGKRSNLLNAQAKIVTNDRPQLAPFNNALLTRGKTPEQFYIEQNQNSPELAKQVVVNKYKAEEAARLAELKRKQEEERYLASIPKGPVSDNMRTVIPDIAVQAQINKPAVDAAMEKQKKEQAKFESESWKDYEKRSLGEKALDRTKAFMVDPFGMTSRFLTGEQAYFPGMGEGLLNTESENYNKYLNAVGYTPGTFEASDIQNMINPMFWGASIGNNINKGNYGTAALEGALTVAGLPGGLRGASRNFVQGSKYLANDVKAIGNTIRGIMPEEKLLIPEQKYVNKVVEVWNPETKMYESFTVDVPQEIVPGRSYADVQHKMKNLRKDLGIGPVEHFWNKTFGAKRSPATLVKDSGMVIDPETGRLFDSNTRYWLNREYGITPKASELVNENYLAKNYGQKLADDFDNIRLENSNTSASMIDNAQQGIDDGNSIKVFEKNPDKIYKRAANSDEIEKFKLEYPNNVKSVIQESWNDFENPRVFSRDAQKEAFDEATEFSNKWLFSDSKSYDEYKKAIDELKEDKLNFDSKLTDEEKLIQTKVYNIQTDIRKKVFDDYGLDENSYVNKLLNGTEDDKIFVRNADKEIAEFEKHAFNSTPNARKLKLDYDNIQARKDMLQQNIDDLYLETDKFLDPEFKRKVDELHTMAMPNIKGHDKNYFKHSYEKRDPSLVYMDEAEESFKKLPDYDKEYLRENFNDIGGVRTAYNTITLGSIPDEKVFLFEQPRLEPIEKKIIIPKKEAKLTKPSSWKNIFDKDKVLTQYESAPINPEDRILLEINKQRMINPAHVGRTNAHEFGHDMQKVNNWVDLIEKYMPEYGYSTNHDYTALSKRYKDAMVDPVKIADNNGKKSYETWKSGVGELHSELMPARMKAVKHYMKNDNMSMDDAIKIVKEFEKQGNPDLFDYYLSEGNLDKHFKPQTPVEEKRQLIQYLPATLGTIGTIKVASDIGKSPLPQEQRFGGNISNLHKFLR